MTTPNPALAAETDTLRAILRPSGTTSRPIPCLPEPQLKRIGGER
jgi:hypothetical protein